MIKGTKKGVEIMRTTLLLDEVSRRCIKELPRSVSISAVLRWVLKAIILPEKEFYRVRDASEEGLEVRDYLRGKIEKLTK